MPAGITLTLQRPAFTVNDVLTAEQFNGVTLTGISGTLTGVLASDGSVRGIGTQAFDRLVVDDTLSVTGATTLAQLTAATLGVTGAATVGGTFAVTGGTTLHAETIINGALTVHAPATINGMVTLPHPYSLTAHGGLFSYGLISTTGNISCSSGTLTAQTVTATTGTLTNLTSVGTVSLGTTAATKLRVGTSGNRFTGLAAKVELLAVTLAAGATTNYEVDVGVAGLNGALASVDWVGLNVLHVLSPSANGNTKVRVYVRNDSGAALASAGVRCSVIAFAAE